ncbi:MAG: TRAP transporter small permease [Rhodospirillales bacterium]
MLEVIEKLISLCARALLFLGAVAIVLMMSHVMVEVALRTLFDKSIPGTEEIVSGYYMVAVVFLPLAYVQLERGHVIIELFTLKAGPRLKAWMDGFVYVVCSGALGIFTYATFDKAINMTTKNEMWIGMIEVTIWPARWILPFGLGIMMMIMILQAIREFQSAITGERYQSPMHAEDSEQV